MSEAGWFWTVYVLVGVGLIFLAWYGGRRRRLTPREIESAKAGDVIVCARCGYDVRGLPGAICPECGSDLDEVGRSTPTALRWQRLPAVARVIGWTMAVVAAAALPTGMAFESYIPIRFADVHTYSMGPAGSVDVEQLRHVLLGLDESITGLHPDEVLSQTSGLMLTFRADTSAGALTLEHDRLHNRWELDGSVKGSGEGPPPADAIAAFAEAVANRPSTRPATADDVVAARMVLHAGAGSQQLSPEALRVTMWLLVNYLPKMSDRWLQPDTSGLDQMYDDWQHDPASVLPPHWIDVDGSILPFLMYPSTPAVSTQSENFDPKAMSFAIGWWGVVWVLGVPFVSRGQRVRLVAQ